MRKMLAFGLAVAVLAAPAGAAFAHDEGYGYESGYGYGSDYGRSGGYGYGYGSGYSRYGPYGYGYEGRGYGYGYDVTARARYCRAHAEFHRRQAEALSQGAYYNPEWREWNYRSHVQFHYSHPGSWRCDYLPGAGAY